jgi:hypothetical protein
MNNMITTRHSQGTGTAKALVMLLASIISHHACPAAVSSFQNGAAAPFGGDLYTGCQDAMLVSNNGNQTDQNFGGRSDFEVGESPSIPSSPRHTLIRFDVTSFAGQFLSISNVTLRLFVTADSSVVNGDVLQAFSVAAANSNWIEGSGVFGNIGDPADVGMSTWAQKIHGSANWAGSAGASTPGVDYVSTPLATFRYGLTNVAVGTYVDLVFTNTNFFLDWIAGTNSGLLLRTASQADSALDFASSQSTTLEWRPQLIVRYTSNKPETNVLSIRLSQVELCWPSTSNTLYQVQYRSDLTTNIWTDLGAPVQGSGSTNCIYDAILLGEPRRFYRFVTIP